MMCADIIQYILSGQGRSGPVLAVPAGRKAQQGPSPARLEEWWSSMRGNGKIAMYEFGKAIFNDQLSFQNNSYRTGGFRAKQTRKKSWLRSYRGKKRIRRKPDSSVLAEEQSVHNTRKTWHRLLDLFSVLSKEQCWKSGRANTIPRTALPAVITLAALCAAQPNRTCKTCSVPGRESALKRQHPFTWHPWQL